MSMPLNAFLKHIGVAQSGGEAKHIIQSGNVAVNGEEETRNKRQLVNGDVVVIQGKKFVVDCVLEE